ncbi:MAG TPA: aspartate/glutamate racemase family protein [Reyranella sp.]|nr:aspartate/glutamate racemase family protein [Reyranella sp.]
MHIGLIGGIGPAATDFYYRGLIDRHVAAGIPLECTIAHADVRTMSRNLNDRTPEKQAAIFAGLIGRMKAAGAEIAAVTSMGGHFCINELLPISPLPLVHGIHAVDAGIRKSGLKKVGVLGTRTVMETRLYGGVSSAELIAPEGEMFGLVGDTYSAMATVGKVTDAQREVFFTAGHALMARGAEAIMLGGTDLFLAFQGRPVPFPLVDNADIHVDAIFAKSSA